MNNNGSANIRRFSGLGILLTAAGLAGCVSTRPVVVAPAYAPPLVVQAPPTVTYAPPQAAVPAAAPGQAMQQLNDAQIAGIMIAANNAEIREAQLALVDSREPRVRRFAQRMIAGHTRLNNAMQQVAVRLGLTPVESQESRHLQDTAQQALAQMSSIRDPAFTRTYLKHQVATHTTIVNGIDRIMLPNARHPAMQAALRQARAWNARHLQRAQQLAAAER